MNQMVLETNQVSWISTSSKKADTSIYCYGLSTGQEEGTHFDYVPEINFR